MSKAIGYFCIALTLLLSVTSQVMIKWQVNQAGSFPSLNSERMLFIIRLLFNPWVLLAICATFLSGITWMVAMTRFEISYAYPFMSLSFILILLAGFFIFHDALSLNKLIGTLFIVFGLIIIYRP